VTPGKYDLNLYRGDTYSWRFVLWQDVEKTQPVDLTGALVEAEIRDKHNGAVVVNLECTPTLPNIIDVQLPIELWDEPFPTKGVWDLEVKFPDGEVRTQVAGNVTVTADVTNSEVAARTRAGR
jgi:hypothetical protein